MISGDSLNDIGARLGVQGELDAARLHYVAALQADPNNIPALMNLGVLAGNRNELIVSCTCFTRLCELQPHNGAHWSNLGNTLSRLEKFPEAIAALDKAKALAPDVPGVWHNCLLLAHKLGQHEEALGYYQRLRDLGIDSPSLTNDKAHVLLAMGRLDEAFVDYEARWHTLTHMMPWDHYIPEWQGEDLRSKRILFHGEQGFGDTIMAARFARNLRDLGALVTLCVPSTLVRLFVWQNWGIDVIDIDQIPANAKELFDFHSPMYSAMRHLGIGVGDISPTPYIAPPQIDVPKIPQGFCNIGICWASGHRGSEMDWRRRQADLNLWLPLLQMTGIRLWSLQKGPEENDIANLGLDAFVGDHTRHLGDWADTAAYMAQLDVVICVDTAIAHLAGGMGKSVVMLAQHANCWRWWNIAQGSGEPWYQNMCIIPQETPGDWAGQIQKTANRIKNGAVIGGLLAGLAALREALAA